MFEMVMRVLLIFCNCCFLFMAGFATLVLANIVIKPDDYNSEIIMRILNGIPGCVSAILTAALCCSLYCLLFNYPLVLNFILEMGKGCH